MKTVLYIILLVNNLAFVFLTKTYEEIPVEEAIGISDPYLIQMYDQWYIIFSNLIDVAKDKADRPTGELTVLNSKNLRTQNDFVKTRIAASIQKSYRNETTFPVRADPQPCSNAAYMSHLELKRTNPCKKCENSGHSTVLK